MPATSALNVCDSLAAWPTSRQVTGLASHAWPKPARSIEITCADAGRLREVEAHVAGAVDGELADACGAAGEGAGGVAGGGTARVEDPRLIVAVWRDRAVLDLRRTALVQALRQRVAAGLVAVDAAVAVVAGRGHVALGAERIVDAGRVGAVDEAIVVVVESVVADLLAGLVAVRIALAAWIGARDGDAARGVAHVGAAHIGAAHVAAAHVAAHVAAAHVERHVAAEVEPRQVGGAVGAGRTVATAVADQRRAAATDQRQRRERERERCESSVAINAFRF